MAKINIVLPIAGFAQRFINKGMTQPKPLLPAGGVPMIKLAIESLIGSSDPSNYKLIFVVRAEHIVSFDIVNALKHLFPEFEIQAAAVNTVTQGTLCSCLIARDLIDLDSPLIVYTPDVAFQADFDPITDFVETNLDGMLLTFKANSVDHSYASIGEDGLAILVREKEVISNDAIVGVYGFKTGRHFLHYADIAIARGLKTNNEFYVAPIYNYLIADGLKIGTNRVEKMYVLGTPDDLAFYEAHVVRYKPIKQIAVCCDHSGFVLKSAVIKTVKELGVECVDFGAYSNRDSDHYDSLKPCIEYLISNPQTVGVASCLTGQGFNIAANKVAGIRAVIASDAYTAEMGRRHNAANFFSIPSRTVAVDDLKPLIAAILHSTFDGGRHATRIQRIERDGLFSN